MAQKYDIIAEAVAVVKAVEDARYGDSYEQAAEAIAQPYEYCAECGKIKRKSESATCGNCLDRLYR